ncbi:alpha-(1,3)-fucosyltransferase C-like isoform X1 [Choristoneura fumiferana]
MNLIKNNLISNMTPGSWHEPETEYTSVLNVWKCYLRGLPAKRLLAKRLLLATSICILIYIYQSPENKTAKESTVENIKYILMWTPAIFDPFSYWKCHFSNCYFTTHRDFFGGKLTKFDAIIFYGPHCYSVHASDLPKKRSNHQKYIFLNMESSDNQPICDSILDGFFNWTATYKLNSDIKLPYMLIRNKSGHIVGPSVDMTWDNDMPEYNETSKNKTRAAAWFVSHCHTRSKREKYAEKLESELHHHNLTLDVYGKCGNLSCTRKQDSQCFELLKNTYFFYLSFENSFAEDYITEKVKNALLNDVVPIVYGAANYSRFLPPGSYIDARKHEPKELASIMAHIIKTPAAYHDFFRWKSLYTYHPAKYVCRLCAVLNNQTMLETRTTYKEMRRWWNPVYKQRCKDRTWGS